MPGRRAANLGHGCNGASFLDLMLARLPLATPAVVLSRLQESKRAEDAASSCAATAGCVDTCSPRQRRSMRRRRRSWAAGWPSSTWRTCAASWWQRSATRCVRVLRQRRGMRVALRTRAAVRPAGHQGAVREHHQAGRVGDGRRRGRMAAAGAHRQQRGSGSASRHHRADAAVARCKRQPAQADAKVVSSESNRHANAKAPVGGTRLPRRRHQFWQHSGA